MSDFVMSQLPGCHIAHDYEDSLSVDWNGVICGRKGALATASGLS